MISVYNVFSERIVSIGGKNTAKVDLLKKTAGFELVQLVGITSTPYKCWGFLEPYIKGFLLAIFGPIWDMWAEPQEQTAIFRFF